jgi:hypothetical protein
MSCHLSISVLAPALGAAGETVSKIAHPPDRAMCENVRSTHFRSNCQFFGVDGHALRQSAA